MTVDQCARHDQRRHHFIFDTVQSVVIIRTCRKIIIIDAQIASWFSCYFSCVNHNRTDWNKTKITHTQKLNQSAVNENILFIRTICLTVKLKTKFYYQMFNWVSVGKCKSSKWEKHTMKIIKRDTRYYTDIRIFNGHKIEKK